MASLGLPTDLVEIHDYSPEWPLLFEEEKASLTAALGNRAIAIEHIGSTSVPGLGAKPILDLMVGIESFESALADLVPVVQSLGYEYCGEFGIPRRHYFRRGEPRTHQIHTFEVTDPEWKKHLAFRDFLRNHKPARDAYDTHKRTLAPDRSRAEYQDAKGPLIQKLTDIALKSVRSPFLETVTANGISIAPYEAQFAIPAITEFVHRGYASVAARGLRFVATHQTDGVTHDRIVRGQTFLGTQDDALISIISVYGPRHDRSVATYRDPHTAYFGHFTVDPSLRRSGVGSLMVEHAERYARSIGFDYMALDTAEPATDLLAYYAKRGYEIVERVKWDEVNYPSMIMRKEL
jgi:GrpB-like predicted nucleotidyltransferase (UPF0157 family)/GNAT superfamily N-acetyltransferase